MLNFRTHLFTGERERERERESGTLRDCKGAHTLFTVQRENERGIKRGREKEREM
jgi:hypothetical protein